VLAELDVALADVRFARNLVERITSGKVARSATREKYLAADYRPQPPTSTLSPALLADPAALEGALLALARQMLGAANLSPQDNLFDVGADSLTAMRMSMEIEQRLDLQIPPAFFHNPTIRNLTSLLQPNPASPATEAAAESART
jgi:acyl carrier protein